MFADEKGKTEITDKNSVSVGYESDGHTGGAATCSQKAVCTECEQEYGEYNTDNHVDTDATSDNSMIHLWLVLLAVSALGIVAVTVRRKAFK